MSIYQLTFVAKIQEYGTSMDQYFFHEHSQYQVTLFGFYKQLFF